LWFHVLKYLVAWWTTDMWQVLVRSCEAWSRTARQPISETLMISVVLYYYLDYSWNLVVYCYILVIRCSDSMQTLWLCILLIILLLNRAEDLIARTHPLLCHMALRKKNIGKWFLPYYMYYWQLRFSILFHLFTPSLSFLMVSSAKTSQHILKKNHQNTVETWPIWWDRGRMVLLLGWSGRVSEAENLGVNFMITYSRPNCILACTSIVSDTRLWVSDSILLFSWFPVVIIRGVNYQHRIFGHALRLLTFAWQGANCSATNYQQLDHLVRLERWICSLGPPKWLLPGYRGGRVSVSEGQLMEIKEETIRNWGNLVVVAGWSCNRWSPTGVPL
jgi:hypothetical protein